MENQPSINSLKEQYFILEEATIILNRMSPPSPITTREIYKCASMNKIQLLFDYDGKLSANWDPASNEADKSSSYSYKGKLAILNYKYGEGNFGPLLPNFVFPKNPQNLLPDIGAPIIDSISHFDELSFSPFTHTLPKKNTTRFTYNDETPILFFYDITVSSNEISSLFESIITLKQDNEKRKNILGRYTLEEAVTFLASCANSSINEIGELLFNSVREGHPKIFPANSNIPIPHSAIPLQFNNAISVELFWDELNSWLAENLPRLNCKFPSPHKYSVLENANERAASSGITNNKLRRNTLDPAIDKAIKQAGNMETADVYLKLKELAINGEQPFTGMIERNALCYTNDNNKPAKLNKDSLGKRLKKRT